MESPSDTRIWLTLVNGTGPMYFTATAPFNPLCGFVRSVQTGAANISSASSPRCRARWKGFLTEVEMAFGRGVFTAWGVGRGSCLRGEKRHRTVLDALSTRVHLTANDEARLLP